MLDLARRATRLRAEHDDGLPLEVVEAVAGLQDLAVTLAPEDAGPRRATFADLQASLPTTIHTEADGPYLVTNPHRLQSWLGVDMPTCRRWRCAAAGSRRPSPSATAPTPTSASPTARTPTGSPTGSTPMSACRSPCATTAAPAPTPGSAPTGCRPSSGARPTPSSHPSGGRMDEIVRAVQACPSGALSLAADERETRDQVDQDREPAIEVSKDGPYRITGGIPCSTVSADPVVRNAGASLEHYSLCRCGHSQNKPFCSGMHWYVEFHDPPLSDEPSCSSGPVGSPPCGG